ncbi:hypothetical protein I302_101585 [Kwoniella bestiolae CBS 10118]|uniref:Glutamate-1-semialdehyde 2,1-aminomutase n=1 Tax=Kwoniella bestiolae CBS 10118 TaxID=1296100 RepID=A0A1B9GCN5_9TREE|nr:hypothetical protein I302_00267 [Kwoniella bestiolae CBS 10118]OCF28778.1 hypothetical protein I302_00267 [Kwoniella bestiolae CBS 10118]
MTITTQSTSTSPLSKALSKARQSYAEKNPSSLKAYEQATKSLPGGGTRSSIFIHPFPLFIERGEGTEIVDVDGHVYLDFVSDFTSGIYGKTNPVLKKAIIQGLDNGLQLGAHTPTESSLSSALCDRFPSMDLLRFTNSGTEANILAISTGLHCTRREKVVLFQGGYHGSVLSHFGEEGGGGDLKVPYDFIVCPYNDIPGTRDIVQKWNDEVGVIIVEPMIGAGGCIPGDPQFLQFLRDLSTQIGAVLIFDEVQTARLGTGGRQKILGITPDMTTLGKFFGGGFAFGAFGGKEEIMSLFDARQPNSISHGGTFNNSPLTMIAGLTAVQHILTEDNLNKLNKMGDGLREELNSVFQEEELPFNITGLGSINQIHYTPTTEKRQGLDLLFFYLLDRGYWIAQRGLISLNFAMTQEDVRGFEIAVVEAAREVGSVM